MMKALLIILMVITMASSYPSKKERFGRSGQESGYQSSAYQATQEGENCPQASNYFT